MFRVFGFAVVIAGCYSPKLQNCTVTCESASDCGGVQVCGSDHLCSMPNVACEARTRPDDAGDVVVDDADVDGPTGHDAKPAKDAGEDIDAKVAIDAKLPPDAPELDAAVPPDAPPDAPATMTVKLHIKIDGKGGHVDVDTGDTCADDCQIDVPKGVARTLTAVADTDQQFDKWMGACNGGSTDCTVTPTMPMTDVHAKFKK